MRRDKEISTGFGFLIIMLLFICFTSSTVSDDGDSSYVKDMAGRSVKVDTKSYDPIVALHAVPDQIIDRLAPDRHKTAQKNFVRSSLLMKTNDYDRVNALPLVSAFYEPSSTEKIVSLNPSFIVTLTKDPKLESRSTEFGGKPVLALSKDTLSELARDWKVMGNAIIYSKPLADKIFTYLQDQEEIFANKAATVSPKKRVWLANKDEFTIPAPQTIMQDAMKHAGGLTYWDMIDYAESLDPTEESVKIPIESMIDFDPEVIFCSDEATRQKIISDERLKNVSAVQYGKVYAEKKAFRIDSMTAFAGTAWMMNRLYPDLLGVSDLDYAKEFYKVIFDSDITEKDIEIDN